ncbi:MAG TPA: hypothetical protein VGB43_01575, partial [Flavobacterium sp.]
MNKIKLLSIILLLTFRAGFSQTDNNTDAKVISSIADYFKLDRENIHLQLNKEVYLSDETLWFKGYVIEKKTGLPYLATTNVYVQLLDANGIVLISQLIYAENSTFRGHLKLKKEFKSDLYYLRAFTNYMNNFIEDESTSHRLSIINPTDDKYKNFRKVDPHSAKILFYPESGVFLEGTTNTIGVRVEDCNGNGIPVSGAEVFDSNGVVVNNFSTDAQGYGKFDIVSAKIEQYTASCQINSTKVSAHLPMPTLNGVVLSVNNYALANKTIVKLKANKRLAAADANFKLIIHKNGVASVADIALAGKTEISVAIPNDNLSDGINTMYLTDKNYKPLAERIIFNPGLSIGNLELQVIKKTKDSVFISGRSALKLGELSGTILSGKSIADDGRSSIFGSLMFNSEFSSP